MNQADEVLRDRMIPARVERFADELRLPAKPGDILLVIDGVAGGRVLPIVNIIEQDRDPAKEVTIAPCAAACLISTGASPLLKQLITALGTIGMKVRRQSRSDPVPRNHRTAEPPYSVW